MNKTLQWFGFIAALGISSLGAASPVVVLNRGRSAPAISRPALEGNSEAARLGNLFQRVAAGERVQASADDVQKIRAIALHAARGFFKNGFNSDSELKERLNERRIWVGGADDQLARAAVESGANGDVNRMQRDVLKVILSTFTGQDRGRFSDTGLRSEAMWKLAEIGKPEDIDAILPYVRKGNFDDASSALQAIPKLTARVGSPDKRGVLKDNPGIQALLSKNTLTPAERNRVIEEVLKHGEIVASKPIGGTHVNQTYKLTFKETLPGKDGTREPIEALWKPEQFRDFWGRYKPNYTREVAAYRFDKAFSSDGDSLIPPTEEAIIGIDGPAKLGSIQFWMPHAKTLGRDNVTLRDEFVEFTKTQSFQSQAARMRLRSFLLDEGDRFPNNMHGDSNHMNILVDEDHKLHAIDFGWSLGLPGVTQNNPYGRISRSVLPDKIDRALLDEAKRADTEKAIESIRDLVHDEDVEHVRKRVGQMNGLLEERVIKN
jgi:hypothetical protein